MDPLLTIRVDPALRAAEKQGGEYEPPPRRRPAAIGKSSVEAEVAAEPVTHQVDDLA